MTEMNKIPYEDKFPLKGFNHIYVSGIGPARNEVQIQQNNIHAILTVGTENRCSTFEGFEDPSRYLLIDLPDSAEARMDVHFDQIYNFID